MKERWIDIAPDAGEKQESQFATWLSAKGVVFENPEREKDYRDRVSLIKHAVQMKNTPERVPVCPAPGNFPITYCGFTPYEAMYDHSVLPRAWLKYCLDFDPDSYGTPSGLGPGKVFDILDFTLYKWAGHGVSKESPIQFVEAEYMRAEEYLDLIDDPSGYFLRVYFPRIFGSLKPFQTLPNILTVHGMLPVVHALAPIDNGDFRQSIHHILDASVEAVHWSGMAKAMGHTLMGKGYPTLSGGACKAPFDLLGDTLRGTAGVMMDMYRHPDELLEACERLTPFMVKAGVASGRATGQSLIFMPLHKGADGFMSDKQFQRFYWPTLKKVIYGLVNEGMVPLLFAEGGYNSRLEVISDLPKGTMVWWFDQTDMARAKETVGKVACLAGNVPIALLCTGKEEEVRDYCKNLIDIASRDGGFILSTGAGMEGARPENVKAMIDFSKEYGIYR